MIEGAREAVVVIDPPETDIYYPEGEPVPEGERHSRQCTSVVQALRDWLRDKPDGPRTWVGDDVNVYWRRGDVSAVVAPDVAVAFGVDVAALRRQDVYKVWETGVMPAWVLEVASPRTRRTDERDKPAIYAELGVVEYWRADPTGGGLMDPPLQGWRLTGGRWRPIAVTADESGTLRGHSALLGLDLCWQDPRLRLYDPTTGDWLLDHDDLLEAHADAQGRADSELARAAREADRAAREAARADRAEAELAALRRRLEPPPGVPDGP